VDETKWEQKKSGTLSELEFSHVSGDVWAMVETDLFATPTTLLRENVLKTVKSTNPNAKIINEEQRLVNGRQIIAIQFSTRIDGNPIRALGYYHGGSSGWIQAIAFARDSEFTNNIGEITDFLDGLEISDQDLPSSGQMSYPGFLFVNSRISVTYDPARFQRMPSDESGPFDFGHLSGGGARLVVEPKSVPVDSIPEFALSGVRSQNPDARILTEEKRTVNGTQVWFVKIEMGNGDRVSCGYYHSDKSWTVALLIYADKKRFSEHEKDFMDFLNGLRITE